MATMTSHLSSRAGDAAVVFLLNDRRFAVELVTGCSSRWWKCRSQMPGVEGRLILHDDSNVLNRFGNKVEALLMQEMRMAGLDGFTTDDAKNE